MTQYICTKAFKDIKGHKRLPGEPVEANSDYATKLRRYGLIGGPYRPIKRLETAVKSPSENEKQPDTTEITKKTGYKKKKTKK